VWGTPAESRVWFAVASSRWMRKEKGEGMGQRARTAEPPHAGTACGAPGRLIPQARLTVDLGAPFYPPGSLISRAPLAVDPGALYAGDVGGPFFDLGALYSRLIGAIPSF
jgi:hypothetical protein